MKPCGVLLTSLLACCVVVESVNAAVPVTYRLSSRIKRQSTGGDPNLEAVFGQQGANTNFNQQQFGSNGNGQTSFGNNEPPPFGFGFSGLNEGSSGNNNGGFGFGGSQNQGSSGNTGSGGFNNLGSSGFGNQGSQGTGGQNQGSGNFGGSNQGSLGSGGQNQGSSNGGFGNFGGNNQGSLGNSQNAQNVQRPQTTQRTPLNLISMQNTIDNTECARQCRNRATQQYRPVCGSDSITYINEQVFNCYQRDCRRDVSVLYSGSCVTTRAPESSTSTTSRNRLW